MTAQGSCVVWPAVTVAVSPLVRKGLRWKVCTSMWQDNKWAQITQNKSTKDKVSSVILKYKSILPSHYIPLQAALLLQKKGCYCCVAGQALRCSQAAPPLINFSVYLKIVNFIFIHCCPPWKCGASKTKNKQTVHPFDLTCKFYLGKQQGFVARTYTCAYVHTYNQK